VGPVYAKVIIRFAQNFDVFSLKILPFDGRKLAFDIPLESLYLFVHCFAELMILRNVEYMVVSQ
jgi:hypothetical protein